MSKSDDLRDTIDYVVLAQLCEEIGVKGRYHLVEKYASDVLQAIVSQFLVQWAWIRVTKPSAIPESIGAIVEMQCGVKLG